MNFDFISNIFLGYWGPGVMYGLIAAILVGYAIWIKHGDKIESDTKTKINPDYKQDGSTVKRANDVSDTIKQTFEASSVFIITGDVNAKARVEGIRFRRAKSSIGTASSATNIKGGNKKHRILEDH